VHSAEAIGGPWARQSTDVNCDAGVPVCAGMAAPQKDRPTGHLTVDAQGLTLSVLPTRTGQAYLWGGNRWLSGPHNPPRCTSLCQPAEGECAQPADYIKGHDFDYWIPLAFGAGGEVLPFAPFVDEFELDLVAPPPTNSCTPIPVCAAAVPHCARCAGGAHGTPVFCLECCPGCTPVAQPPYTYCNCTPP
jgi:hypothetical protein